MEQELRPLSDREKFEMQAQVSKEQFEIAKINLENAKTQLEIAKVSADCKKFDVETEYKLRIDKLNFDLDVEKLNSKHIQSAFDAYKDEYDKLKSLVDSRGADFLCLDRIQELAIFIYIILGLCVFNSVLTFFF